MPYALFDQLNDSTLVKTDAYFAGSWHSAPDSFSVANPDSGETVALVADSGAEACQAAIDAAYDALPTWSSKNAQERFLLLEQWHQLMISHQDDLAKILTIEQGKPLTEAKAEIAYGASYIQWFAEEGKRVYGDTIPAPSGDKRVLVIKQPVGVVSAITPWNFPNAMIARKAAAALAAGCPFVVRPSELTPLSALAMAQLADRAGIPAGVFNVVPGLDAPEMGKVLTQDPKVAKFTFTGSTQVGKILTRQCASTVKKVSMELGGNAPFIVFDDADIDAAVSGAIASKFRNAGQTCVCSNRFLVQDSVLETFTNKFTAAVQTLRSGNGLNPDHQVGPLISAAAAERVDGLVKGAVAAGASIEIGGQQSAEGSHYYPPTVLSKVTNDMPVAQNEIFGPVAPIIPFTTEAEAIALANDTEYGLAAYFYARDIGRVWRVSEQLQFGMVGINEGVISNAAAPFGGVKQSGYGREGSKYGLDDYMEIKYLCMGGLSN